MNSMITTKLNDISYSILEVERKNKVPYKHYGNTFYVEATSLDRNPKFKKFIKTECNILHKKDNVKLYIERDVNWGIGIYYEWEYKRTIEHTFNTVSIKGLISTVRIPVQSVIGLNIKIICDLQKKY